MKFSCRGVLGTLLLIGVTAAICATPVSERTRQKQLAEARRATVQSQLDALKQSINQTETATGKATAALDKSAQAISRADRSLHELETEQHQTERTLAQLTEQQSVLATKVAQQQATLSKMLRDHYVAGSGDQVQLLLSGDDPNRINRDLRYLGYLSQAQATMIASLRDNLQTVEANKAAAQQARESLSDIAAEARDQRALLEREKKQRNVQLVQLSSKLATQRKQATELQRDDQRLSGLVTKLESMIEEQRKAEAAAAEQRRKKLADAKARQNRKKTTAEQQLARATHPKAIAPNVDAIDDDTPPSRGSQRNESIPEKSVDSAADSAVGGNFASLRGQLRLPIRGDITLKFGGSRGDGPSSKGVFIRSAEGAEVRAIAGGRVVFADWLRGFGNLIIVDHGSQYLTVYGNNQSVLKHPGDVVKGGDAIARAGSSGGNEQVGLYFEIRHQGRAFDPMTWVTTR